MRPLASAWTPLNNDLAVHHLWIKAACHARPPGCGGPDCGSVAVRASCRGTPGVLPSRGERTTRRATVGFEALTLTTSEMVNGPAPGGCRTTQLLGHHRIIAIAVSSILRCGARLSSASPAAGSRCSRSTIAATSASFPAGPRSRACIATSMPPSRRRATGPPGGAAFSLLDFCSAPVAAAYGAAVSRCRRPRPRGRLPDAQSVVSAGRYRLLFSTSLPSQCIGSRTSSCRPLPPWQRGLGSHRHRLHPGHCQRVSRPTVPARSPAAITTTSNPNHAVLGHIVGVRGDAADDPNNARARRLFRQARRDVESVMEGSSTQAEEAPARLRIAPDRATSPPVRTATSGPRTGAMSRCGMPRDCASRASQPPDEQVERQVVRPSRRPGSQGLSNSALTPARLKIHYCSRAAPMAASITSTRPASSTAPTGTTVRSTHPQQHQRQPHHHGRQTIQNSSWPSSGHPVGKVSRASREPRAIQPKRHGERPPSEWLSACASGATTLRSWRLSEAGRKQRRVACRGSQHGPDATGLGLRHRRKLSAIGASTWTACRR